MGTLRSTLKLYIYIQFEAAQLTQHSACTTKINCLFRISTAAFHLCGPFCSIKHHTTLNVLRGLNSWFLTCSLSSGTLSQWLNAWDSFVRTCFPRREQTQKSDYFLSKKILYTVVCKGKELPLHTSQCLLQISAFYFLKSLAASVMLTFMRFFWVPMLLTFKDEDSLEAYNNATGG